MLNIVQQRSCKAQLWPSRLPSCPSHTTSSLSPHLPRSHLPFVFLCKQCFMGCVLRLDSVEKAVLFLVVLLRAEHALIIKSFNRTAQKLISFRTVPYIFSVLYTDVLLIVLFTYGLKHTLLSTWSSNGRFRNTALWSFETFANHLFWINDSEYGANCQSHIISVIEASLCNSCFRILWNFGGISGVRRVFCCIYTVLTSRHHQHVAFQMLWRQWIIWKAIVSIDFKFWKAFFL